MRKETVDIQRLIDNQKLTRFQVLVVLLCATIALIDGFDAQSIGYIAPAIIKSWHISRLALSPVFSSGLVGMMIGALCFGPIADRFGRKPVLVVCTLFLGVSSLLTATADSMQSLLIFRILTGIGLGGAMPNVVALTTEYSPSRIRHTVTMLMFTGFSIGAALGGFAAAAMIGPFGWKSVFVLGGIMPLIVCVIVVVFAPESLRFMVLKGGHNDKIISILAKIVPTAKLDAQTIFTVEEHKSEGFTVRHLFTEGRARLTLLIWLVFFMNLLDMYFLSNWLPTMINDSGISVKYAVLMTALFQIGGSVAPMVLGRFFDRFSAFKVLSLVYLGASVLIVLIGVAGTSVPMLFLTIFGTGVFVVGGMMGAIALAANLYPTAIRSTGVGWAFGIGRIGSICGPIIGGILLSLHWDIKHIFMIGSAPVLCAATASLCISLLASQKKRPVTDSLPVTNAEFVGEEL